MKNRRQVIGFILSLVIGIFGFGGKIRTGFGIAHAKVKRFKRTLLPRGAPMAGLISKNPRKLDTRNLETTPMDQFDVMGQDIYNVNLETWRLDLSGALEHPQKFRYEDLLKLPAVERNVLLICPGFFAYNGLWKGVSLSKLLTSAKMKPSATHVKLSGPRGIRRKSKKFAVEEVMADKIFLAFQVNGEVLPERHGFPVRLVAEDHYGGRWVKYVDRIQVIKG
ncbi:molybdopterin-dependent oxidoreductase [Desulfospira joergensenii]|uniref:molybdopterin-dependent oxidoreductase n=1 Tax=Desulfospira joergensenii TaxID=53329 RepID=UPI0003B3E2F4|nr:molybdopterin-dependent oxidoreductase [Desulfospira joergensenii]